MSIENLSDSEIRSVEAEIKARREEVKPTYQHYGSAESLSDNEIRSMEAQVAEKRKLDAPFKEYLTNLISNPVIFNVQQFEDAVIRSMQSNVIMKDFTSKLVEEISKVTYEFRQLEKTDSIGIKAKKLKLEQLINIYVRYLNMLKVHDWTFYSLGNGPVEMVSFDMLDDLWQVQKEFGITFIMPIPKDLGEYYGASFEREGKMVPGITLMHDDLTGKEVNWHQVLIYKENELTPYQRYLQRREEKLKSFEEARQEEISNNLAQSKDMGVKEETGKQL